MDSTKDEAYAEALSRVAGTSWKQRLNVQAPYQWNLRRKKLGKTLEVGCGVGRNLVSLPGGVGVDHNPFSIATARERGFTAWTSEEWPKCPDAVDGSFDTLLLAHVLEHLTEDDSADVLNSYLRYMKPDARLVLICPQERGFTTGLTHIRFLDIKALEETARKIGFTPISSSSFPLPRIFGKIFTYNEFVVVARRN